MADFVVKEIINPFRKEESISKIELSVYSNLIKKKEIKQDNSDLFKDLYSQLFDPMDMDNQLVSVKQ